MLAQAPIAAAPNAALWRRSIAAPEPGKVLVGQGAADPVWGIAVQRPAAGGMPRAPIGIVGALPIAARSMPAGVDQGIPVIRYSDRGWLGEPGDALAPNEAWPARLLEPPAIERAIPIYPTEARRSEVNAGEITLANGDGALDVLTTDWRLAGRAIEILRGPYRSPVRAARSEFATIGTFRITRLAQGSAKLQMPLASAAADLTMAVSPTYGGTGGQDGTEAMAGQNQPVRYGIHRNVSPVQAAPNLLGYHLHTGRISAVLAIRARGAAVSFAGDYPDWESFAAAVVAAGTYITCLALGWIRLGNQTASLTVDFRGAAPDGYGYLGTAAGIAAHLLRTAGGVTPDRAAPESFYDWPVGEVRLDATGQTVAQALEDLAAGVGGWWGADAAGRFRGSALQRPEDGGAGIVLAPWMLASPPQEVQAALPPWYRVRVAYQVLGTTQVGADLADNVPAADRAYFGQPYQIATQIDTGVQSAFPGATDGPLVQSAFDDVADADALALRLLELFGKARRSWQAVIRSDHAWRFWGVLDPGQLVRLTWPNIAALRDGRTMVLRGYSARGDRLTLDLWG
jgi:hypothetical protein